MSNHYKLHKLKEGIYQFTTDQQVVYSVYFGDGTNYFSDYPEFSSEVLTFGFDKITSPVKTSYDIKIKYTITSMIIEYLRKNQEKVLFFVCDSADSRGAARMKIFEHWYKHLHITYLEKHNESIHAADMEIHYSIILHSNNNLKDYILDSFRRSSSDTTGKLKSY